VVFGTIDSLATHDWLRDSTDPSANKLVSLWEPSWVIQLGGDRPVDFVSLRISRTRFWRPSDG